MGKTYVKLHKYRTSVDKVLSKDNKQKRRFQYFPSVALELQGDELFLRHELPIWFQDWVVDKTSSWVSKSREEQMNICRHGLL